MPFFGSILLIGLVILVIKVLRLRLEREKRSQEEGFRIVRVMLSEDYDTDVIKYLNKIDNKSAFFILAARDYIENNSDVDSNH